MITTLLSPTCANRPPLRAAVQRGEIPESRHLVHGVETDDAGHILHAWGDPALVTAMRSAAKPIQATLLTMLPAVDGHALTDEELAICCASHPGLPRHAALAASVLALSGAPPEALVCGPTGNPPSPLRHGCSGNHAALLLTAHRLGANLPGYEQPGHPAQQAIRQQLAAMAGTGDILLATDGCGIPTYGLPLWAMARAFAALAQPGAPWERLPRVMGAHPALIGDETWIDVRLMQVTRGRVVAKTGAEGLLCLCLPGRVRGMALKMEDGSTRALGVLTLAALLDAEWITPEEAAHPLLAELRHPRFYGRDGALIADIVRE